MWKASAGHKTGDLQNLQGADNSDSDDWETDADFEVCLNDK